MRKHRWPKLTLLFASFFLVGGAGALEGALAAQAKNTCVKCCKSDKKDCFGLAKSELVTAKEECTAVKIEDLGNCGADKDCKKAVKLEFKTCKNDAKAASKLAKEECKTDLTTCKDECTAGGSVDPTICPPNAAGGPNVLKTTVVDGADLDSGWTGVGHNSGVVIGASIYACLQGCDLDTNPVCTGVGLTGACARNKKTYGPPLPLLAADVATCVINEFTEDITVRELNLETGAVEMRVKLNSIVHLTGDKNTPCPTCSGATIGATGTCRGLTSRLGQPCTTEGTTKATAGRNFGNTSSDCPPFAADNAGELEIVLDPVTSGTATLAAELTCSGGLCPCSGGGNTPRMNECDDPASCSEQVCIDNGGSDDVRSGIQPGLDQQCCRKGREIIPCFIDDISRTGEAVPGEPRWPDPTYPKTGVGKVAAAFCIPATNSSVINIPTGLGGPGAFILPGRAQVEYQE